MVRDREHKVDSCAAESFPVTLKALIRAQLAVSEVRADRRARALFSYVSSLVYCPENRQRISDEA
jgi:hypothetical protein